MKHRKKPSISRRKYEVFDHFVPFTGRFAVLYVRQQYEDFNVLHREREDYVLTLSPSTRPHLGKNRFRATLTDSSGRAITDARITFHYSMHGMRGAEKGALTDNGNYEAEIDLVMGGEWTISIEIERPGIEKIREKFIIDAGPY